MDLYSQLLKMMRHFDRRALEAMSNGHRMDAERFRQKALGYQAMLVSAMDYGGK